MSFKRIVSVITIISVLLTALFIMPIGAAAATSDEGITIGNLKGWGWITKSGSVLNQLSMSNDGATTQPGAAHVPNGAQGANGGYYTVSSASGNVTHTYTNEVLFLQYIGLPINPAVDTVMFYVEIPDYAKDNTTWGLGIQNMGISKDGVVTNVNPTHKTEFSYLPIDGSGWVTSTTTGGADRTLNLPSGFKGYIRINFENLVLDKEVDLDTDYSFDHIKFKFNAVGGNCGNVKFGGIFYAPSNSSDSTVMEIGGKTFNLLSDEYIKVNNLKGWGYISKNVGSFSKLALTNDNITTQVGAAYVPSGSAGANKGSYIVSSVSGEVTHTYVNEIMYMQYIGLAIDPNVDTAIFYVELPDYAKDNATWGLGIQGMGIVQNEVVTNANPTHQTVFSYLPIDGSGWVDSTTTGGADRTLNLPSGFKGYVRLNFENLVFDKKADGTEVDLDSAYSLNHINFKFNAVGGDCGNVKFGGIFYAPSNKSNATVMKIENETFNLLSDEYIKVDTLKGWGWITKDVKSFSELALTNDNITTQVGAAYVPSASAGANKGSYIVSSVSGEVTHTYVNEIMYMQYIGLAIDPNVDTAIFYVELPDYAKDNATWGLGIQGMGIVQNEVITNVNPTHQTVFSYLSVYGSGWVDSTTTGGADRTLNLPSGFKGYVRLNFENLVFDKKADGTEVDLDSAYSLNHINFKFNAIGGDCGNVKFGGIFYAPSNKSNATVMKFSDEKFDLVYKKGGKVELVYNDDVTANTVYTDKYVDDVIIFPTPEREGYTFDGWYSDNETFVNKVEASYIVTAENATFYAKWIKNIEVGDMDGDGFIKSSDLIDLRKIVLGIEKEYDASIADVNGDGEVDIRDLVRIKKVVATSIVAATEELTNVLANGGTVALTDNVKLDTQYKIAEGTDVVIDLNGKNLTLDYADNYALNVKGDLTIKGEGNVIIKGYGLATGYNSNGVITIDGGTFTAKGCDYMLGCFGGEVIINGGIFNGEYCVVNNFSDYYGVDGTVTINGGTFSAEEPILGSPVIDNVN